VNRLRYLLPALLLLGVVVAPPASATAPVWSAGDISVPSLYSVANGQVTLLSCLSAGNCLAGGWFYTYANDGVHTFLEREDGLNWSNAISVPDNSGGFNFEVNGLTCATNECIGVGSNSLGAQIVHYSWSSQSVESFPVTFANQSLNTTHSSLKDVACTSDGNCVAGGYVNVTAGANSSALLVDSETNGSWANAVTVPLPSTPGANPGVNPGQVGCISSSRCVYIGSFNTREGQMRPFIAIRQNGTWLNAVSPQMPSNAASMGSQSLSEISCVAGGTCTAAGSYHTTAGTLVPFSVTITANSIDAGVQIPLPANAAPSPKAFLFGFHGLDCSSTGNCSLGAQYSYQVNGVTHFGGFLTSEVNGVWNPRSQSTFMQVPPSAASAGQFGGVVGMSCWSSGNCVGAVAYVDSLQNYFVGVDVESNGVWAQVTGLSMPSNLPAGAAGGLYALRCFSANACSGVGSYQNGSRIMPFHLNSN